jgi:hypothetical protein
MRVLRLVGSVALAIVVGAGVGCGDGGIGNGGGDGDGGNGGGGDGGGGGGGDGGPNEFGDAGPLSCKKIDVIIAVDNSSSMSEEKSALANDVFPAFAQALINVSGGIDDFRVGVLDACPNPANYHTVGVGGACNFASGQPWMEHTDPNLAQEFACVGNVDSSDMLCSGNNDDEQPASAAATSMEDPWKSGQNLGFLRDDALLVVIAITDEDEQPVPSANAQQVYNRLIAAKGGDVKRMVFLGIAGASACQGVYGTADQANTMLALTNLFKAAQRGVFWDLCQGQLQDGLTEALQVIEQACDELPPIE